MIPTQYVEGWAWFAENAGRVVPWSSIAKSTYRLACTPKGIYKPEIGDAALSIRQTINSPYDDLDPAYESGTWLYQYHQEGDNFDFWTNRAVVEAMKRGWPVGVLRPVPAAKVVSYEVMGLAWAVEWRFGHFMFQGLTEAEASTFCERRPALRAVANETDAEMDLSNSSSPTLIRLSPRVVRQGQREFRRDVVKAYGGRCCITGFEALPALQAAHISGYSGPESNTLKNGLLLRADLHLLFDSGMIAISPSDMRLRLHRDLARTRYADLLGSRVRLPTLEAHRPNDRYLELHRIAVGL